MSKLIQQSSLLTLKTHTKKKCVNGTVFPDLSIHLARFDCIIIACGNRSRSFVCVKWNENSLKSRSRWKQEYVMFKYLAFLLYTTSNQLISGTLHITQLLPQRTPEGVINQSATLLSCCGGCYIQEAHFNSATAANLNVLMIWVMAGNNPPALKPADAN